MLRDFQFGSPYWGALLILTAIIGLLYFRLYRSQLETLRLFKNPQLKHRLLVFRSRRSQWIRGGGLVLAWFFAVIALMQPKGAPRFPGEGDGEKTILEQTLLEEPSSLEATSNIRRRKAHEVLFLLDTSASMEVKDTRVGLSRLDYAKEVIDELSRLLNGQNVALYAFTSEVSTLVPPTLDTLYLRLLLKHVGINEGDVAGTDLIEALGFVRKNHFKEQKNKLTTLVVLTDGGDTRLESSSGEKRERELSAILSRVSDAEKHNLRVFTIGLGTQQGGVVPDVLFDGKQVTSSLDEELLKRLSSVGRGAYYFANDYSSLSLAQDLMQRLSQDEPFVEEDVGGEELAVVEQIVEGEEEEVMYDLYFQIPLGISLLLLTLALSWPSAQSRAKLTSFSILWLPLAALSPEVSIDLEDARCAQEWYEGGQYEKALGFYNELLESQPTPSQEQALLYNRAMTFSTLKRWEEAIVDLKRLKSMDGLALELKYDVWGRIAITQLQRSRELCLDLDVQGDNILPSCQLSLEALTEAEEALKNVEGLRREALLIQLDLKHSHDWNQRELKVLAREQRIYLEELQNRQRMMKLTFDDGLKELLSQVASLSSRLELWGIGGQEEHEQERLLRVQKILEKGQQGLWKHLRDVFKSSKEEELQTIEPFFLSAEEQYLRGIDLLDEGRLWEARESAGLSHAYLRSLQRVRGQREPLEGLLQDLLAARMKRQKAAHTEHQQSLEREDRQLHLLAAYLAGALIQGLQEREEEKKSIEQEVELQLLKSLKGQLEKVGKEGEEASSLRRQAESRIAKYQTIFSQEGDLLLAIQLRVERERSAAQENQERTWSLFESIRLLEEKFTLREEREEGEEKERSKQVLVRLREALTWQEGVKKEDWNEVAAIIDEAFVLWDPVKALTGKLIELNKLFAQTQRETHISREVLEELKFKHEGLEERMKLAKERERDLVENLEWQVRKSQVRITLVEQALTSKRFQSAKLFLFDGAQWMQRALKDFTNTHPPNEERLLRQGILEEQFARDFNESLHQLEPEEGIDRNLHQVLLENQQWVLNVVAPFEQIWQAGEEQKPQEVLHLFLKGKESAEGAKDFLDKEIPSFSETLKKQEEAIEFWEKALEALKKGNEGDDSSGPEGDSSSGQQEGGESKDSPQKPKQNVQLPPQQVFELLQEMDREDQRFKEGKKLAPKKGLRPW